MSNKTRVTSGARRKDRQITHLVPKHSPLHASPNYPSPGHHNKSPKRDNNQQHVNNNELVDVCLLKKQNIVFVSFVCFRSHQNNNNNALASLPSIDDFSEPPIIITQPSQPPPQQQDNLSDGENRIDVMSDTSSSSSDSDSDSDGNTTTVLKSQSNGHATTAATAAITTNNGSRANLILNEDLCLSESGSDSD